MAGLQVDDDHGVTSSLGPEPGPSPAELRAVTSKVYEGPFSRPAILALLAYPGTSTWTPPCDAATVYVTTRAPPSSAGGSQRTDAPESADVAWTCRGGPGGWGPAAWAGGARWPVAGSIVAHRVSAIVSGGVDTNMPFAPTR